ncbi:MAG: SRPBCC domain-containing protein [Planctomyces sp.]|nr:SRPBCC domain-containing protein [Planctomyces sp.]
MPATKNILIAILLAIGTLSAVRTSSADVKDSSDQGFSSVVSISVNGDPRTVFDTLIKPSKWWNPAHSWSGDAANMSIDPVPGGAFLEKLPDGGFCRHMEVVYAEPGKLLRMHGGLGPLQEQAIHGSMTVRLRKDGDQTVVDVTYNVTGYVPGGISKWSAPVDGVLSEQFDRLKKSMEGTLEK